jgi:tripartite-type tricarboxylate transporter receptor subunit TctC
LAPASTPLHIIDKLNKDLAFAISSPEIKDRLLSAGLEAKPSSPSEFQARIAKDIKRWSEIVKIAKIEAE